MLAGEAGAMFPRPTPESLGEAPMTTQIQTACDVGVLAAGESPQPCAPHQQKWVLAATVLGSSMAFIDGTAVNVALRAAAGFRAGGGHIRRGLAVVRGGPDRRAIDRGPLGSRDRRGHARAGEPGHS